jgi:hypothetical protein
MSSLSPIIMVGRSSVMSSFSFFSGPCEDHCILDTFASQKEKPTLVDN